MKKKHPVYMFLVHRLKFAKKKAVIEEQRPGKRSRTLVYFFDQPVNYSNPSENVLQLDNQKSIR